MSGRTVTAADSAIAIGWSFQCQLDERRILTAQTHVPSDATSADIDAALDKIANAMDRMQARYKVRELERHLKMRHIMQEQAKKDSLRIENKLRTDWERSERRGPFKLNDKQESEKQNFQTTIDRIGTEISETMAEIEEQRALLNGAMRA